MLCDAFTRVRHKPSSLSQALHTAQPSLNLDPAPVPCRQSMPRDSYTSWRHELDFTIWLVALLFASDVRTRHYHFVSPKRCWHHTSLHERRMLKLHLKLQICLIDHTTLNDFNPVDPSSVYFWAHIQERATTPASKISLSSPPERSGRGGGTRCWAGYHFQHQNPTPLTWSKTQLSLSTQIASTRLHSELSHLRPTNESFI